MLVNITYTVLLLTYYRDLQSVHAFRTQGTCPLQTTSPEPQDGFVGRQSDHVVQQVTKHLDCPKDLAHWLMMHIHHWEIHAMQLAFSLALYRDLPHLLLVLHKKIR